MLVLNINELRAVRVLGQWWVTRCGGKRLKAENCLLCVIKTKKMPPLSAEEEGPTPTCGSQQCLLETIYTFLFCGSINLQINFVFYSVKILLGCKPYRYKRFRMN